MFSHLGREGWNSRDGDWENLLDVLQRAGLAVLWLDNQPGGCKGVCDRVPTVNTAAEKDPALCPAGECHDAILLKDLDSHIAALPAERRARDERLAAVARNHAEPSVERQVDGRCASPGHPST